MTTIPFQIPEKIRNQHQHVVAGSGHGKTNALTYFIREDIRRPDCAVVVIDSQGDLTRDLSTDHSIKDRVLIIDPADMIEYPIAVNLFKFGRERIAAYSIEDREALLASAIELYDYFFEGLLQSDLTGKQSAPFRFAIRLMMEYPDATLYTLLEYLQAPDDPKYLAHINRLNSRITRDFLLKELPGQQFKQTRQEIVRRLYQVLENNTFNRIFSATETKLDLFTEINTPGRIIVVNTNKHMLKEEGCSIFGRFFIALLVQAIEERVVIPEAKRLRLYVYIDECQDYIDRYVKKFLEQARKYNAGLILAHQQLEQILSIYGAVDANTAIKMVGGLNTHDTRSFAEKMSRPGDWLRKHSRPGQFATSIRGHGTFSLEVPFVDPGKVERVSPAELAALKKGIRDRYCFKYEEPDGAAPPPVSDPIAPSSPANTSTSNVDPTDHAKKSTRL